MTPFGIFACAVLLFALASGIGVGAFAIWINDPALAFMAGAVAASPIFAILGRVWLRGEIEASARQPEGGGA